MSFFVHYQLESRATITSSALQTLMEFNKTSRKKRASPVFAGSDLGLRRVLQIYSIFVGELNCYRRVLLSQG